MSIQKLREERMAKAKEYRNILDQNPGKLTEEEGKKLSELMADIDGLDGRIKAEEAILAVEAENMAIEQAGEKIGAKKGESKASAGDKAKALFNKWVKGGDRALNAEDWEYIRNTMSTTTDAEGGYTVQTEVASRVLDALKDFGGMREAAEVIRTTKGNPMTWPTSDGRSEVGEIVAENTEVTDADISFGTKALPVYKYSSKVVTVPIELLQDTEIDMEPFVNNRIAQRLGRITNTHFTVGTGSGQPLGIVAGVTVGLTGASGQLTTFIYTDLVTMEHSIDPAYRKNAGCKWMLSDTALKAIKNILDANDRPLWLPNIIEGAPSKILGYPYIINQDVAVPAASAKSLVFGDLRKYVIRDVMSLTYHRFTDSAYAKKGQVGFLAFLRSGGNYMDVGGAVKVFQHAAS